MAVLSLLPILSGTSKTISLIVFTRCLHELNTSADCIPDTTLTIRLNSLSNERVVSKGIFSSFEVKGQNFPMAVVRNSTVRKQYRSDGFYPVDREFSQDSPD